MNSSERLYFSDEGILSSGEKMNTDDAAFIGRRTAHLSDRIVIGIRSSPCEYSSAFAMALAFSAAALEEGSDVFFAGEVSLPELIFAAKETDEDFVAVFINAMFYPSFRFFDGRGEKISREKEDLILCDNANRCGKNCSGNFYDISSIRNLYFSRLKKLIQNGLDKLENFPYSVIINSPSSRIRKICSDLFPKTDGSETIAFHINEDGVKVTAFTESTGYIQYEKLVMTVLKYKLKYSSGEKIAVPTKYSDYAKKIAGEFGVNIEYSEEGKLDFYNDTIVLIVELLKIIQNTGLKMDKLTEDLPEYAELDRYIPINSEDCTERIKLLYNKYNNDKNYSLNNDIGRGITITDELGKISVTPIRSGKGIILHAQSRAMETAAELCDFYESILREKS